MKVFAPEVKRQTICSECGGKKSFFVHNNSATSYGHNFQPRLETIKEAYYRAGRSDGSNDTADRLHWGPGWD